MGPELRRETARMRVGFIGLGLMGTPMAAKVAEAGHSLTVWGRTASKLQPVLALGAEAADSPRALAETSDVVLLCVTDTDAVEMVVFGDDGVAAGGVAGKVLIDHSSIQPDASRRFAARLLDACGMDWLDAPVSGGPAGVERGTLVVMAGGEDAPFAKVKEVVASYAARFTLMGPPGAGQSTKLINQTLVAAHVAIVAEATQLALDAGIDAERIPQALAGGRADSVVLQDFMPRMIARDFEPAATLKIMLKDLEMIAGLSSETGTAMPITRLVSELHRLLIAKGLGDQDNSAMIRLYDTVNDI
ncbi:MAG: NAD(P)-dependent oxidoreductase [Pseudomonadota bacterium]|nr:NAD(P)-dependent oxidoreductase [Pseudomonadota bacterium]